VNHIYQNRKKRSEKFANIKYFLYFCTLFCEIRVILKKKVYILSVLLTVVQLAMAGTQLNPETAHFLSVWGQVGASTLLNNSGSSIKPAVGVSPSIGVGYRMCYNDFLLQIGAEAQYAYYANRIPDATLSLPMLDTEDDAFVMKAQFSECKDWMRNVTLVVPLLMGYEHQKFYFLLGPEFAYSLYAVTSATALLNTSANYYNRYMEDFVDMPGHQLFSNQQTSSGEKQFKLNYTIYAHAEIGLRLGEVDKYKGANIYRKNYRLYLSLFADYGVLNIHQNTTNSAVANYEETSQGVQFYVVPAMLSSNMNNIKVNPLTVGIKFTAAFQLPEGKNWMIYNGKGSNNYQRVRGKSQVVNY